MWATQLLERPRINKPRPEVALTFFPFFPFLFVYIPFLLHFLVFSIILLYYNVLATVKTMLLKLETLHTHAEDCFAVHSKQLPHGLCGAGA